jgi:hypothetical protein
MLNLLLKYKMKLGNILKRKEAVIETQKRKEGGVELVTDIEDGLLYSILRESYISKNMRKFSRFLSFWIEKYNGIEDIFFHLKKAGVQEIDRLFVLETVEELVNTSKKYEVSVYLITAGFHSLFHDKSPLNHYDIEWFTRNHLALKQFNTLRVENLYGGRVSGFYRSIDAAKHAASQDVSEFSLGKDLEIGVYINNQYNPYVTPIIHQLNPDENIADSI